MEQNTKHQTEITKATLRRWYDEMWSKKNPELVHELVADNYLRHETNGTVSISRQDYYEVVKSVTDTCDISPIRYELFAEDDKACVMGTWQLNGQSWYWTQVFRVEDARIIETWSSGIVMDSHWDCVF